MNEITIGIITDGSRPHLYKDTVARIIDTGKKYGCKLVCWVNSPGERDSIFSPKNFDFIFFSKFNTFKLPLNYLLSSQSYGRHFIYLDDDIFFGYEDWLTEVIEVFEILQKKHNIVMLSRLAYDADYSVRSPNWEELSVKEKISATRWFGGERDRTYDLWHPYKDGKYALIGRSPPNSYYWLGGFLVIDREKLKIPLGYGFPYGTDGFGQGELLNKLGFIRASYWAPRPIYHIGRAASVYGKYSGAIRVKKMLGISQKIMESRKKLIERFSYAEA